MNDLTTNGYVAIGITVILVIGMISNILVGNAIVDAAKRTRTTN